MQKIIIIGLGGIGSALIEPLVRFTQFNKPCEFLLIDGDLYERKNRNRQRVISNEINRSKADVWKLRITQGFYSVQVNSVREYITPLNIKRYIKENDIVMMCVDNYATRKLVQEHCSRLRTVTLISGGNDYTDGNVQVFRKERGRILSAPITTHHPEIEFPEDKRPDEIGCDEKVTSDPQLLFANFTVASLMLNAYYAIINNQLNYTETYFDIISNKTKTFRREV
jgi:molybdopterin/thiamine biosynthesis adenylyltransferase